MRLLASPFCKTTLFGRRIRFVGSGVVRRVGIDHFKLNGIVALPIVTCWGPDCSIATSHIYQPCGDVQSCYRPFKDSQCYLWLIKWYLLDKDLRISIACSKWEFGPRHVSQSENRQQVYPSSNFDSKGQVWNSTFLTCPLS